MEPHILWLAVDERDSICEDCLHGPHIHVTTGTEARKAVIQRLDAEAARDAARAEAERVRPVLEQLERVHRRLDAQTEAIGSIRLMLGEHAPLGDGPEV